MKYIFIALLLNFNVFANDQLDALVGDYTGDNNCRVVLSKFRDSYSLFFNDNRYRAGINTEFSAFEFSEREFRNYKKLTVKFIAGTSITKSFYRLTFKIYDNNNIDSILYRRWISRIRPFPVTQTRKCRNLL